MTEAELFADALISRLSVSSEQFWEAVGAKLGPEWLQKLARCYQFMCAGDLKSIGHENHNT